MLRHFRHAAVLVAALACTGCGIKGPLVLPPPAKPPAATPPAATPSTAAPPASTAPAPATLPETAKSKP